MLNPKEYQIIQELKKKYPSDGDELQEALTGFYYLNETTYWDYLQVEILHRLQQPKTGFDDEMIFIVYHQISELLFKLILHELQLITSIERKEYLNEENWIKRVGRVVNYCHFLTDSLKILQPGTKGKPNQFFSKEEFSQFRQTLAPASGFQSVSIRKIEFYSTSLYHLLHPQVLNNYSPLSPIEDLYQGLYWKFGSWKLENGKRKTKTKTLLAFEKKYDEELIQLAHALKNSNLFYLFFQHQPDNKAEEQALNQVRKNPEIRKLLASYDQEINRNWKNVHFLVVRQHLNNTEQGTGGTNWQEYLPPERQMIIFFPELKVK